MMWMNEYEIDQAVQQYSEHPVLGPATRTLANVRDAANANSDGWCFWPKPARAAGQVMEMVVRDGTSRYVFDFERADATAAEYKKAVVPLKAFRTRSGIQFDIEEV